MKNKDKLRKLTWNYFWVQKVDEILKFLSIIGLILVFPLIAFVLLQGLSPDSANDLILKVTGSLNMDVGFWTTWACGLLFLIPLGIASGAVAFILWLIFGVIEYWIKSNWKLARKRAKKELRRK